MARIMSQANPRSGGISAAIATYTIWGLLPIYFKLLTAVPALELVGWRIVFTLPVCLAVIAVLRQGGELRTALANPGLLLRLGLSAMLVGGNWLIYVSAVNAGHVLAASLGYYIIPLINVLLGTVFLGERLGRLQWVAVAVAASGIGLLAWAALDMLAVAVTLAISFALYGYVRKVTPVGAVPGLTIEAGWLLLPAIGVVMWFGQQPAGSSMAMDWHTSLLILSTGIITAFPLLLFAFAAQRLDLSTLGFVQFISPTIGFLLGHFLYGEPLDAARTACFVLIWVALALFSWDMLHKARMNSHTRS
jgi:chloramphenicol-sensitive protein RarD